MQTAVTAPGGGLISAADAVSPNNDAGHAKTGFWALTLGSLGVVYGDIGTSPLSHFASPFWPPLAQTAHRASQSCSASCR